MFRTTNDIVIDATNVTTTDITAEVMDCSNRYGISVHAISTGTIAGTVQLQVSNDGINWVALTALNITINNSTNLYVEKGDLFCKFARVFYDATSGTTNTLKVYVTSKAL